MENVDYKKMLDRLYYTTTTNDGSGIKRSDAYKSLLQLVSDYEDLYSKTPQMVTNNWKKIYDQKRTISLACHLLADKVSSCPPNKNCYQDGEQRTCNSCWKEYLKEETKNDRDRKYR